MENTQKSNFINSRAVLAIALVLSTLLGAFTFYRIRSFDNTLTVTGSATKEVESDHVKWVGIITHVVRASTLKQGYADMTKDLTEVKAFLKDKNIPEEAVVISPVFMDQNYDQPQGAERSYTLRQTVDVNSDNVALVTDVAKNINPLIEKGVVFSTQSLEYTYSKLAEERVALLSDAIRDAKARASKLAESSGKKVGQLKSASSGVVQVLSANSLDVSDYGSYDTSKVSKNIMLTVKASFTLE
jgi:hypothetical protein